MKTVSVSVLYLFSVDCSCFIYDFSSQDCFFYFSFQLIFPMEEGSSFSSHSPDDQPRPEPVMLYLKMHGTNRKAVVDYLKCCPGFVRFGPVYSSFVTPQCSSIVEEHGYSRIFHGGILPPPPPFILPSKDKRNHSRRPPISVADVGKVSGPRSLPSSPTTDDDIVLVDSNGIPIPDQSTKLRFNALECSIVRVTESKRRRNYPTSTITGVTVRSCSPIRDLPPRLQQEGRRKYVSPPLLNRERIPYSLRVKRDRPELCQEPFKTYTSSPQSLLSSYPPIDNSPHFTNYGNGFNSTDVSPPKLQPVSPPRKMIIRSITIDEEEEEDVVEDVNEKEKENKDCAVEVEKPCSSCPSYTTGDKVEEKIREEDNVEQCAAVDSIMESMAESDFGTQVQPNLPNFGCYREEEERNVDIYERGVRSETHSAMMGGMDNSFIHNNNLSSSPFQSHSFPSPLHTPLGFGNSNVDYDILNDFFLSTPFTSRPSSPFTF